MEPYIPILAGFGLLVLLTAWLPMLLKEAPLSLPILCVGFGAALFALPWVPGAGPTPQDHLPLVERFTEFVVIISLMSAGLKIDRVLSWRGWMLTWRLLGVAMPLTIAALFVLGQWMLGLGAATALLLAAVLAPTDPVLASDIQVGPPSEGEEDEVRFALTSEASLNDALAFPFVNAAIALAAIALVTDQSAEFRRLGLEWFTVDVVWKLFFGVAAGYASGRVLGWLLFRIPNRAKLSRTGDGFVALGITCVVYGLTELGHGYGFLAVIVAALAVRSAERGHSFHQKLHDFAEELERLLMMALLVCFGGALTRGGLLDALTWEAAAFGLAALFLVRPALGWFSLGRLQLRSGERAVISFYGIRGLGSVYYLAYALQKGEFEQANLLWSTLGFVMLVSIVLHGATVTPVMRRLDRETGAAAAKAEAPDAAPRIAEPSSEAGR